MADPSFPVDPAGLKVPATLKNLASRPVLKNADGSFSTERSISIGTDQGEVLIPTVVGGKQLSKEEAKAHYRATGEHLGIFDTPASADAYATALHNAQQARVLGVSKESFVRTLKPGLAAGTPEEQAPASAYSGQGRVTQKKGK